MLELTISTESGGAVSWQKYRVPLGLSVADIQVCIASLLEWPTVPARHREGIRQEARNLNEQMAKENNDRNTLARATETELRSGAMAIIGDRPHYTASTSDKAMDLRTDRSSDRTKAVTSILPDEDAFVSASNERIAKMVLEGNHRAASSSSSATNLSDDKEYPVFRPHEPDLISDDHWHSNNYYRIQMKVSTPIPQGWISQVAQDIDGCDYRTSECRVFRGTRTLFIWCEPQAEFDAVRELCYIVAQRFRPSEHKLQVPKSFIIAGGGGQAASGTFQTTPQLALGERGLMFQLYGTQLRWIAYRELRTNLYNASLLPLIQYLEYKTRPARILLIQTGPEVSMYPGSNSSVDFATVRSLGTGFFTR